VRQKMPEQRASGFVPGVVVVEVSFFGSTRNAPVSVSSAIPRHLQVFFRAEHWCGLMGFQMWSWRPALLFTLMVLTLVPVTGIPSVSNYITPLLWSFVLRSSLKRGACIFFSSSWQLWSSAQSHFEEKKINAAPPPSNCFVYGHLCAITAKDPAEELPKLFGCARYKPWCMKTCVVLASGTRLLRLIRRVRCQLSILTPPGGSLRHLILKRGDLWRTAKNRRKSEPRRNRRQNTSRKAAPIRTARARFCKCPSGPISGMRPAVKILLRFPIRLAATLILPSPTNFKVAP